MFFVRCDVVDGNFECGIFGDGVNGSGFYLNHLACRPSTLAVTIEALRVDVAVLMCLLLLKLVVLGDEDVEVCVISAVSI